MNKRAERRKKPSSDSVSPEQAPSSGETKINETEDKQIDLEDYIKNSNLTKDEKDTPQTYIEKRDLEIFEDLNYYDHQSASPATDKELLDLERDYMRGKFS